MDAGGEHALIEIADDLRDVDDFQGLLCTVSHLGAKGVMLKGLKVLLTGAEVLFAGVDGWLSMNFFYYSCFDVDMREQFRCSGNRLVATCSSNEAWLASERTWELDRGEIN